MAKNNPTSSGITVRDFFMALLIGLDVGAAIVAVAAFATIGFSGSLLNGRQAMAVQEPEVSQNVQNATPPVAQVSAPNLSERQRIAGQGAQTVSVPEGNQPKAEIEPSQQETAPETPQAQITAPSQTQAQSNTQSSNTSTNQKTQTSSNTSSKSSSGQSQSNGAVVNIKPNSPSNQSTQTQPKTETVTDNKQTIYGTRTGGRYHYSNSCNGGTYFEITWDEVERRGLTPCNKCVL